MENKLEKIGQNSFMDNFVKTDDILKDMCGIIESSQKAAYQAVNTLLVQRNWLIGYRIAEEELGGDERSEYGLEVIKKISKELTQRYGKGYDRSNLYHCLKFYKTFPEIVDTACRQSGVLLSWSHYRTLLQVKDPEARDWYEKEAAEQTWSVRTLQRNISSQYYYRMLGTQKKELVESEMKELTAPYQNDKLEFIKNPVVAEFLGFSQNTDFTESDLEKSILSNLQKFLMELGKGYAFVARQQHIHTEKQDYYIDLVFYNYILKCFVLIDLKTEKITHQDVGQMDMYIRMYDELKRSEGDNPTIGIVLCSDTDDDIARYSVMHGNEQLFASKYKLYLPTKEEVLESPVTPGINAIDISLFADCIASFVPAANTVTCEANNIVNTKATAIILFTFFIDFTIIVFLLSVKFPLYTFVELHVLCFHIEITLHHNTFICDFYICSSVQRFSCIMICLIIY